MPTGMSTLSETWRLPAASPFIPVPGTMDDQAETFLMRLLRGSGRSGLTGIPVRRGRLIVRPLIRVTRAEVEAYLEGHAWAYRTDASNRDRRYLRNRIRLELLPFLRDRFDPGIIPRLGRLVDVLQAEEAWLESGVDAASSGAILADQDSIRLDMNADLRRISFKDIETILTLEEGRDFTLEKGLVLRRERDRVGIRPDPPPCMSYQFSWDPAAPLHIPELGLTLSGEVLPASRRGSLKTDDRREAGLDAGTLRLPLTVRCRRDGDRYRPLGAPGRAKLKEIFRARGVAPEERDRRPVFVSGESIVWVLGLPVSEVHKISESTSQVLLIRVE
jgi:tRNA(Ile)-lysidine synthase